jgi:hypothetical protein
MSEYSRFILVNRNTLGLYIFVGCHRMSDNSGVGLHKFHCMLKSDDFCQRIWLLETKLSYLCLLFLRSMWYNDWPLQVDSQHSPSVSQRKYSWSILQRGLRTEETWVMLRKNVQNLYKITTSENLFKIIYNLFIY